MAIKKTTIVGQSFPRVESNAKVTGAAQYVDDMQFGPNLLHGRLKRSTVPHAMITRIDTSKARALPGVRVVVTGQDYPGLTGLYLSDRPTFAVDRVRFVGEPVAGVAADTPELAELACELIEVEYEALPGVFDPEFGASAAAPLLHPDLMDYACAPFIFRQPGTNISNWFKVRKGDMDAGWAEAERIYEHTYRVPHVQHVPLETHAAVAQVDGNGKITLWSASQSPFAQRNLIAKSLGISHNKLRVITPYVGGGFGCKAGVSMEGACVVMALHAKGRPVKLVMSRAEEFTTTFVRQGLTAKLKMGMRADGRITAMQNTYYWDGGAYTEYGVNITRAAGYSSTGPYFVPNVHADSLCVYTNHPIGGAMRGFGMPEIHWAIEQHIDRMAEQLGLDPVQVRLLNCLKEGQETVTGMPMHATGLSQCIAKAAEALDWGQPSRPSGPGKRRGKGIAAMWKAPAMPPNPGSASTIRFNEDGTCLVNIGGVDMGQGTLTIAAQLAAEGLGIPIADVRVNTVDTDYSPYEWQTVASRLTWSMGNAILRAADEAKTQIIQMVAEVWGEDPQDLDIIDGNVVSYVTEEFDPAQEHRGLRHAEAGRHLGRRSRRRQGPLHAHLRHAAGRRDRPGPAGRGAFHHRRAGCRGRDRRRDRRDPGAQTGIGLRRGQSHQPRHGAHPDGGGRGAGPEHGAAGVDHPAQRPAHERQLHRLPHRYDGRCPARDGEHHRRGAAGRRPLRRARHRRARHGPHRAGHR